MPNRMSGVLCPVITPFDDNLQPDAARLARQCRWLLDQGVRLAVFGTNSEANSMSVGEKARLLEQLIEAGIPPEALMPGTGCCALSDTVALTRRAVDLGCGGTLMLPPFYYKGVSDDGLYASYTEVIERVGNAALQVYLYHIPPVAGVGLSLQLIERLLASYPETIAGIKDSSGDWQNTHAMLREDWPDFRIFAGSESFLLENMRHGGAGCISATANVNPGGIVQLCRNWRSESAQDLQNEANHIRDIVQNYAMIPALKQIVAHYSADTTWARVRPPLTTLPSDQSQALLQALSAAGFGMPGLPQTSVRR